MPLEGEKLQKIMAAHGIASRRVSEQMIKDGRVFVNGKQAHIGMRVSADDKIEVDGTQIKNNEDDKPYILIYHKPTGQICTRDDPEGRDTVFDHLPDCPSGRWVCVGRLDINTSGLLLFTNSGDLANHLMHPRYGMQREYAIRTMGRVTEEISKQLTKGVKLEDGWARLEHIVVSPNKSTGANHWCTAVLMEGRSRIVRRLFEAVGLTVSRLVRVRFGPVTLPERLGRGRSQMLPSSKVAEIMNQLGL